MIVIIDLQVKFYLKIIKNIILRVHHVLMWDTTQKLWKKNFDHKPNNNMDFFFNARRERSFALELSHNVFFPDLLHVHRSIWSQFLYRHVRLELNIPLKPVRCTNFTWFCLFLSVFVDTRLFCRKNVNITHSQPWLANFSSASHKDRHTRWRHKIDAMTKSVAADCCCANYMWNSLSVM